MKVFISWSGTRSNAVARALEVWLTQVLQSAEPWVSTGMQRGVRWSSEISNSLEKHNLGIVCVTPENVEARWLNFESGALSKQIGDDSRLIPYLLDFKTPSDLEDPLGQFNACLADEEGTFDMVKTLNEFADKKLSEANLKQTFDKWWPDLKTQLEAVVAIEVQTPPTTRGVEDKVDDLLTLVRQMARQQQNPEQLLKDIGDRIAAERPYGSGAYGSGTYGGAAAAPLSAPAAMFASSSSLGVTGVAVENTQQMVASEVVALILRQQGLDTAAMSVMKFDQGVVWVYVPHAIHDSVLEKTRAALKATLATSPLVDFYTSGETERQLIDSDPDRATQIAEAVDEAIDEDGARDDFMRAEELRKARERGYEG